MDSELERKILQLAVAKGVLNQDSFDQTGTPISLSLLIERGVLTESTVADLEAEILDDMETFADPRRERPERNVPAGDTVLPRFSKYRDLEMIGQGGMARVYRAYDPVLGRTVALKFVRIEEPALTQRLLLEARHQARVNHENVCKVYEVGESEERPYICMQFIEGLTLSRLGPRLSVKENVEIIRKIADAVHAAHRTGLVHRDIKPSNVLIEKTSEGFWKPFIVDFGLARPETAPGITETGVIVGTPHYMAPEQARGAAIDARADIYSLGATLYELLSGRPPFEGNKTEVMMKLLHDEPVNVRTIKADISRDLETIVMKCLEKDPSSRYQTAKQLSTDLQNYLGGEPITARPTGWSQAIWKKARKNRLAAAIGVTAFVSILALLSLLLFLQWRGRAQAAYTREFGDEVRYFESLMLSAYTAPLHDIRPKMRQARQRLQHLERRIETEGSWAFGPGHNALGQSYLILKDYEMAKDHLEKAWAAGYRQPSTAYALGKVLGILWQHAIADSDRLTSKALQEQARRMAERQYRRPAVQYLQKARGHVETPAYVEGLIALYEKRYAGALQKAREAQQLSSRPYEILKLEGDIHFAIGRDASQRGDSRKALESFESAGVAYAQAIDMARSDQDVYFADVNRWIRTIYVLSDRNIENVERAFERCDNAIRINPDNDEGYIRKAELHLQYGTSELYRTDAREILKQSIQMTREALRKNPRNARAYEVAARAFLRIGEYETINGHDPRAALSNCMKSARKAIELDADDAEAYYTLASAYFLTSEYQLVRGENPLSALQHVTDIYEQHFSNATLDDYSYNLLGLAYLGKAEYKLKQGQDPRDDIGKALENYGRALKVNPEAAYVLLNQGLAYIDTAKYEMRHGIDPSRSLQKALESYDGSLQINNTSYASTCDRGLVFLHSAEHKLSFNEDARTDIEAAMLQFQKALDLSSDIIIPYLNIAAVQLINAKQALRLNQDASGPLETADKALTRYIAHDAGHPEAIKLQGELELIRALQAIRDKRSPEPHFERALNSAHRGVELSGDTIARVLLAKIYLKKSEWDASHASNAHETIQRGLKWIGDAEKAGAVDPELFAIHGALLELQGKHEKDPELLHRAEQLLQKAIQSNSFLTAEYQPYLSPQ